MSHQLIFFVTPTDLLQTMDAIARCGDFVIFRSRSSEEAPQLISRSDFDRNADRSLFYYLVRPQEPANVKFRNVPAQGYWSVDDLRSPVVQFIRSRFDGRTVGEGRL